MPSNPAQQAPEVAELRAQLGALEQERRAELEATLKRLQDEMAIIQSRETALEEQIKALGEDDAADQKADGLAALKQKLEADRTLLHERLDQAARLDAEPSTPRGAGHAITPAVVPSQPAYPRLSLIWGWRRPVRWFSGPRSRLRAKPCMAGGRNRARGGGRDPARRAARPPTWRGGAGMA